MISKLVDARLQLSVAIWAFAQKFSTPVNMRTVYRSRDCNIYCPSASLVRFAFHPLCIFACAKTGPTCSASTTRLLCYQWNKLRGQPNCCTHAEQSGASTLSKQQRHISSGFCHWCWHSFSMQRGGLLSLVPARYLCRPGRRNCSWNSSTRLQWMFEHEAVCWSADGTGHAGLVK